MRDHPTTPLSGVPHYPNEVVLTPAIWAGVTGWLGSSQPVAAELASYWSMFVWQGAERITVTRIGRFIAVRFALDPAEVMLVAGDGASVTPEVDDALTAILATATVRYVSRPTARALWPFATAHDLTIEPVRDDADYVFSADRLAELSGHDLKDRRRDAGRFSTRYRHAMREGTLADSSVRKHLLATYDRWSRAKYQGEEPVAEIVHERAMVERLPCDANLRVFCLEADGEPAGVSVLEPAWSATWVGVIFKTDRSFTGSTEFLRRHVARAALRELGPSARLNIAQDDGDPGLRTGKSKFRQLHLEPKYILRAA